MKKVIILGALLAISNSFGQAFDGYGDKKTSIGVTSQSGGTGLVLNFDRGLNDHLSYGTSFGYVFSTAKIYDAYGQEIQGGEILSEKLDFNFRMNGHFGKEVGFGDMMDLYGGLNLGTRNLGAQVGFCYLISDGFGFFAEASVPLYKHNAFTKNGSNYFDYYNQPVFGIGIVINN